jgi:hypothetical protein
MFTNLMSSVVVSGPISRVYHMIVVLGSIYCMKVAGVCKGFLWGRQGMRGDSRVRRCWGRQMIHERRLWLVAWDYNLLKNRSLLVRGNDMLRLM